MKKNDLGRFSLLRTSKLKLTVVCAILSCIVSTARANYHRSSVPEPVDEIVQEQTISGTVLDETGQPLPGASIVEKGTTNGTQTDFDGNFTLTVSDENATLSISYVGFLTQEVALNGQTTINVTLQEDSAQLDEVVVVGYGTQKKSDITGSVASVPTEDLQALPIARVDQALQGRISGVNIQNNDAAPNSSTSIRIRGANSINGGNDPLIIIDGFQGGSLNTIHPNDIKSIEVLKDASATAIYGSRGSNGVILITTNSGGKGQKLSVGYSTYLSTHQVREKIDLLNPFQYAQTVNANRTELGLNPVFDDADLARFSSGVGTDWQDEIFGTAIAMNHNISVSGGSEALSYFVSGDILDKDGIVKGSSYDRYSLRANLNADLKENLKLTSNVFLAKETDHTAALNSFAGGNGGSPIFSALVFAPVKTVFDEEGNYTLPGGGFGPTTNYNPVALALEPTRDNFSNTTSINLGLDYEIVDGLKINISGGYRLLDRENNEFLTSKPTGGASFNSASIVNSRLMTLQNTNLISYNKEFNDHNLTFTGVFEQQFEDFNSSSAGAQDFFTEGVLYNNLEIGANPQIPTSEKREKTLTSYMARINYGYKSKYLLTLTGRADGSSVFGADNKWGYFPSAAVAWNVSNENFLADSKTITNLKLRGTWGITGNQAIDPYQSLARLNTGTSYPIDGLDLSTGVSLGGLANPDLKWEQTTQTNFGVDLKLFGGRIDIVADYYKKNTEDLLLNVPLPQAGGGPGTILRNVGEVENKGIELYLGVKPVVTDNFIWESAFTYGKNDNEVIALNGDETEIPLGGAGLPGFENTLFLEVGQPIGLFRGFEYDGVWTTAEAAEAGTITNNGVAFFPGAPKFIDQNNDNVIDEADVVNIGNAQPDYTFGWNNTFTYKNFDLNIFIQGVQGNDIYNLGRVRTERSSGDSDATSAAILNRWTPQNENTNVPSFTGSNTFPALQTSRWLEDGSYIRLKNVTLGYYLPDGIIEKLKINSLKIYATGTNLITWTDYSGFDPESSTDIDTRGGVDLASYPSQKVFTLGLDVKF